MANSIYFGLMTITLCMVYEAFGAAIDESDIVNHSGNIFNKMHFNRGLDMEGINRKLFDHHNRIQIDDSAGQKSSGTIMTTKCCLNNNCLDLKNGEWCSEALFPDSLKTGNDTITSYSEKRSWMSYRFENKPTDTNDAEEPEPTDTDDAEEPEPTDTDDAEEIDLQNPPFIMF